MQRRTLFLDQLSNPGRGQTRKVVYKLYFRCGNSKKQNLRAIRNKTDAKSLNN